MADKAFFSIAFILFGCMLFTALGLLMVRLYREIYFYEGVRLGSRVHGWLYNRWAAQYDADKLKIQARDGEFLVRPLLEKLGVGEPGIREVTVLDVATGTGRFPLALLKEQEFHGSVIGLDISPRMLEQAAAKLAPYRDRMFLLQNAAMPLPFHDNAFEVVGCLESLELMFDRQGQLSEFERVLKPGGVLVLSRNTGAWGRRGITCPPEEFEALLQAAGFAQVEILTWWKWFDIVWARKPGILSPGTRCPLTDLLRCASCALPTMAEESPSLLKCKNCGRESPISSDGIIVHNREQ